MKKIILFAFLICTATHHAQLGGLMKKAEKAVKKETKTTPAESPQPSSTKKEKPVKGITGSGDPFEGNRYWTAGSDYFTADDGIKTDLHKANVEKIVFSKKPLNPATASAADVTETFNVGDNIYALVFMKTALGNYKIYNAESGAVKGNRNNNYKVMASIDGVALPQSILQDNYNETKKGITSIATIFHSFAPGDTKDNSEYFVKAFNALSAGPHKVRVEFWGGNTNMKGDSKEPVAIGEFNLVKKEGQNLKLGRTFADIKALKTDKVLEGKMVKVANTYDYLPKNGQVYSAAKIVENGWTLEKNDLGIILRRTIKADVLAKETNGDCRVYTITFCEDYAGGGTYGATRVYTSESFAAMVDCN